jgi:hypothetical protein
VAITADMGFDKDQSLSVFTQSVYPLLRANCRGCHSTENTTGTGAQAPLHADVNVVLAHEYALTRVNFREPAQSKLVSRLAIDRHNCFDVNCKAAGKQMEDAISVWANGVQAMLPEVPRGVDAATKITEEQILAWIKKDQATTPKAEQEFIKYTSFHVLHNEGVSTQNLNHARVGLSKALNTAARWAPEIANPVDVNGKGILYRFDIRDYWGHTLIDTSANNFALFYGGSDDDLAFENKVDVNGKTVSYNDLSAMKNKLKAAATKDDKFARLVWARILRGNTEGAYSDAKSMPPNIPGFVGVRSQGSNGQDYIKPEDFIYAEAAQLTYTLTRPDVYAAIMAIPGYSHYLEDELAVDKSKAMDSYDYMATEESAAVESRLFWRATQKTGRGNYFWKVVDNYSVGNVNVNELYAKGDTRFPFWANPLPKFIAAQQGGLTPEHYSLVATINLFDGNGDNGGGYFSGKDGGQQLEGEMLWSLPNGMHGYALYGGFNQRRLDTYVHIARDPRKHLNVADDILEDFAGKGLNKGIKDIRLSSPDSCMGCHEDGMNRGNNNLRDWVDENNARLPKGKLGVDGWIKNETTVNRVKELYKPSSVMRAKIEADRRVYLEAMGKIKTGMLLGKDKNVYLEPTVWTTEWANQFYKFPISRSN